MIMKEKNDSLRTDNRSGQNEAVNPDYLRLNDGQGNKDKKSNSGIVFGYRELHIWVQGLQRM